MLTSLDSERDELVRLKAEVDDVMLRTSTQETVNVLLTCAELLAKRIVALRPS